MKYRFTCGFADNAILKRLYSYGGLFSVRFDVKRRRASRQAGNRCLGWILLCIRLIATKPNNFAPVGRDLAENVTSRRLKLENSRSVFLLLLVLLYSDSICTRSIYVFIYLRSVDARLLKIFTSERFRMRCCARGGSVYF